MPYPPNLKEARRKRDRTNVHEVDANIEEDSDHNQDDEMIEDGFVIAAADGACPNQATARQPQRAGCGLYFGKKHP